MKAVQNHGKKVPEDVAIIGFSDGKLLKHATPAVSTVSQHGREMGRVAVKMLLKRLHSDMEEERFSTQVIRTSIIKRKSTAD